MTGAEVVITDGATFILGKVRHSGYDVKAFFLGRDVFDIPMLGLWKEYIKWRRNRQSLVSFASEIQTKHDGGFVFRPYDPSTAPDVKTGRDFDELVRRLEAEVDEDDGLRCGYSDYQLLIDYRSKTILMSDDYGERMIPASQMPEEENDSLCAELTSAKTKIADLEAELKLQVARAREAEQRGNGPAGK